MLTRGMMDSDKMRINFTEWMVKNNGQVIDARNEITFDLKIWFPEARR